MDSEVIVADEKWDFGFGMYGTEAGFRQTRTSFLRLQPTRHTLGGKFTDGPAAEYRRCEKIIVTFMPAARARCVATGHSTQMHEVGRIRLLLCSPGSPFWCIVIVQVENVCGLLLDWQDESAGGLYRLGLVGILTWLNLEVQGYQREDEALRRVSYASESERAFSPHLQILDQIVEHSQTLGIRALVDIC